MRPDIWRHFDSAVETMLLIYLLRHGEAAHMTAAMSDRDRRLTPQGRQDLAVQAEYLFSQHPGPLRIFHSPYRRTRETAELVNQYYQVNLEPMPELVPSGNAITVINNLLGIEEDLLLVTHLPLIADLAMALVNKRLPFFPGSCAAIQRTDPFADAGKLDWFRNPE